MGCVQSQQPQPQEQEKLNFTMERTKIYEFDEVFDSVADPLQTLMKEKKAFSDGKRALKVCVGMRKRLQDPTLTDTLMAMMYCYSTACNGDFSQLQLTKVKKPPFIDVDRKTLRKEFQQIPPAFETFVSKMTQAAEKLVPLVEEVIRAAEKCADFPERATSAANGLNMLEAGRAVLHTKNNVQTLLKARPLAQKTLKKVQDVAASLAQFVDLLETPGTMDEIKRIGAAANEAQCFVPGDIVTNFWPDKSRLLPQTK